MKQKRFLCLVNNDKQEKTGILDLAAINSAMVQDDGKLMVSLAGSSAMQSYPPKVGRIIIEALAMYLQEKGEL